MSKVPIVSLVVPCKELDEMITKDLWPALAKQSYPHFELILVPDKRAAGQSLPKFTRIMPRKTNPAAKRDYGVKCARGEIIVFIDSDAYPARDDWLALIVDKLKDSRVAAVGGPGLTPEINGFWQQMSGYVWSSWLGAGGAGTYRNKPMPSREVDDYPTFNLAVKKAEFLQAGGFNTKYWPGEDTVLCHEIVYTLGKKIIYHPDIPVFHHRRPLLVPHLMQVGRYGLHRGYFTKVLPKTSRRLGYYAPLALTIYLLTLLVSLPFFGALNLIMVPLLIYAVLMITAALGLFISTRYVRAALLLPVSILITHCVYGSMFFVGLLVRDLRN